MFPNFHEKKRNNDLSPGMECIQEMQEQFPGELQRQSGCKKLGTIRYLFQQISRPHKMAIEQPFLASMKELDLFRGYLSKTYDYASQAATNSSFRQFKYTESVGHIFATRHILRQKKGRPFGQPFPSSKLR